MSKSGSKIPAIDFTQFKQFVYASVKPSLQPVALRFWELVEREAPMLTPGMRGGSGGYIPIPVWRTDRDCIALSPSLTALTVSFVGGALFDDPEQLLGGAGKTSRTVKLKSLADLDRPAIASFVRQAAAR